MQNQLWPHPLTFEPFGEDLFDEVGDDVPQHWEGEEGEEGRWEGREGERVAREGGGIAMREKQERIWEGHELRRDHNPHIHHSYHSYL